MGPDMCPVGARSMDHLNMLETAMEHDVGVWIDHGGAIVLHMSAGGRPRVVRIESDVEPKSKSMGHQGAIPPGHLHGAPVKKAEHHRQDALRRFYGEVSRALEGAKRILLFGPGQAKLELKNLLQAETHLDRVITVHAEEEMSDKELAARTREGLRAIPPIDRR